MKELTEDKKPRDAVLDDEIIVYIFHLFLCLNNFFVSIPPVFFCVIDSVTVLM